METLQIDKSKAFELYRNADKSGKELLESLLNGQLKLQAITDRVKTFEDACEVLGLDPRSAIPSFTNHPDSKALEASAKLFIIIRALNEEWIPDWNNDDEYKWYLWFYHDEPGFRLNAADNFYTFSAAGSRLCFRSRELAEYAAKQFFDLYKDLFVL